MAKVSLIWTLLIFHGCLFRHGSTTTIYITPSPATMVGGEKTTTAAVATTVIVPGVAETTTAVGGGVSFTTAGGEVSNTAISGEVTTTLVGEGDVTTTGGTVTNTASVGVIPTTGIGGRVTSIVGGRETSSTVDKSVVSPTSTPTGPPSSTSIGIPPCSISVDIRVGLGPVVLFSLKVKVDCSGGKLKVLTDIVIAGLLKISIKAEFRPCGVEVKSATCNSLFEGKFMLSLQAGGPSGVTIEQVFKDGLQQGAFGDDIRTDNTVYTLEFQGVDIKKTPKPGECERVCCDGAGGEMLVNVTCTPADKCTGIDLSDRKDDGYCPGDPKAYCECSKGLQHLPSFALIVALGLTSLMKSIFSS